MAVQSSDSGTALLSQSSSVGAAPKPWRHRLERYNVGAFDVHLPVEISSRDLGVCAYLKSRQKRTFDLTGALTLLVLLLPLFLLVAMLIRMTSKGPAIFKQKRCGVDGKPFEIWKFRSMYTAADAPNIVQATRGDPRITPIGRFIRRTSIDELPQLFNVVQGHMSLIGPRPHALAHDTYFVECVPRYSDRFAARPGLSGLAQVRGARGETPHVSDMERRVAYDLIYIGNASLAMDLRILGATVQEMMFSSTAY